MPFPDHVEWIAQHMGDALEQELKRQSAPVSARSALSTLCEADPSPDKVAVQWLAERLLDGGFLWEDVRSGIGSKVHETLVTFETHKRVLAAPERRLETHSTLASVWAAVAHMVSRQDDEDHEPGIRERRRMEKAVARDESIILHERPGLIVAIPLTKQAAKWWGRGTRWCTAADKNNAFHSYDENGPLVVIVLPDEKLQLFMDKCGAIQFCDAMDESVSLECVERHWDDIGPLVLWATRRAPRMTKYVPHGLLDQDMVHRAVAEDACLFAEVPIAMRDREMCLGAVKKRVDMFYLVPESLIDHEIAMAAVTHSGRVLNLVPEALRNRDICLRAVASDGNALQYVPEKMRDKEMCLIAVDEDGLGLQFVPEHMRDRKTCVAAVIQCADALVYVPECMRDRDMYSTAVSYSKGNGGLNHVPADIRDRDLCLVAVRRHGYALNYVPQHLRDHEMCLAACSEVGSKTHETLVPLTNRGSGSLRYVPEALRSRDMCHNMVSRSGGNLKYVPMPLRDWDMCMSAVVSEPGALKYVPEELRNREIILATSRSGKFGLSAFEDDIPMDRETYMAGVTASGANLMYVPDHLRDLEICLLAVSEDEYFIWLVPEPIRMQVLSMVPNRAKPARSWSPEVALEGLKEALAADDVTGLPRLPDIRTGKFYG